jgi:uracil-DNA glycosylase
MPKQSSDTPGAEHFLPARISLPSLQRAAQECQGCPLFRDATQTVFGEGPADASMLLIGEAPGDSEDLRGRPFVGPAGRLLDEALESAGITRDEVYVTNAVKHFKFELRGKRRIHKKPGAREIRACVPWLEKEIQVVQPDVVVCLGATAAQALLGAAFRVTTHRGRVVPSALAARVLATIHPSAILRQPTPEAREHERLLLIADLKVAAELLHERA